MSQSLRAAIGLLGFLLTVLACRILPPPPPTPGPFPLESVRQLTQDYTYFEGLKWSRDGRHIAATRCPLLNFDHNCLSNKQAVLIDVEVGAVEEISLDDWTSNLWISSAVTWSPESPRLLIRVQETASPATQDIVVAPYHYLLYSLEQDSFEELDVDGVVIAWGRNPTEVLIERPDGPDQIVIGWLSLADGVFQEETSVPYAIAYLDNESTYSTASNMILSGDSEFSSSCEDIWGYSIGSGSQFAPFVRQACYPTYSLDGSKLAYVAKEVPQAWPGLLMIADADGSNPTPLFTEDLPKVITYPTWSPDGSRIAFTYPGEAGANAVYVAEVPEALRP